MFTFEQKHRLMDKTIEAGSAGEEIPELDYKTATTTDFMDARGIDLSEIHDSILTVGQVNRMANDIEELRVPETVLSAKLQMEWMIEYYRTTVPNKEKRILWETRLNSVNDEGGPTAQQVMIDKAGLSAEIQSGLLKNHIDNLNKMSASITAAFADATLKTNWFTLGELKFVKCEEEMAAAARALLMKNSPLYNNESLRTTLTETLTKIKTAKADHETQMKLDTKVTRHDRAVNAELQSFFNEMENVEKQLGASALVTSPEVSETKAFEERMENASPAVLLEEYKKIPKEDSMRRSIIVHQLMSKHVLVEGLKLERDEKGKYSVEAEAGSKVPAEKISEINNALKEMDPSQVDAYRMSATFTSIEFSIEDKLSISTFANAIMEKYEIKYTDGSTPKYEDFFDDSKVTVGDKEISVSDHLKNQIEAAMKGKEGQELQDLQYLLDLKDEKPKDFNSDLQHVGNYQLIENEFLENGDLWQALGEEYDGKNIERVIEAVLTGNGGMNMIVIAIGAIYSIFKGKFGHVLGATGGLLALQTAEEHFAGTDAQKKVAELLDNISPGLGGMVDSVMNFTGISKPKYEITFMDGEFEATYRDLYMANTEKLEEGKFSESVSEEDFAQIYAQLLANDTFRTAKVSDIAKAAKDTNTFNKVLGDEGITKYKDSLVTNEDNEDSDATRNLSHSKVALVMKMLLNNRDHADDANGADLFAKGKAEGLNIAGGKEFTVANEAVKQAYAKITSDNPEYNNVKATMDIAGDWWKPENYKKLVGIDGEREAQIDTMITALAVSVAAVGEGSDEGIEIKNLIKALENLKDRANLVERRENFLEGTKADTDSRLFGAEGLVKSTADTLAYGAVATAHFFGFRKVNLLQTKDSSIEDIDAKIREGKELLSVIKKEDSPEIVRAKEALDKAQAHYDNIPSSIDKASAKETLDKAQAEYDKYVKEFEKDSGIIKEREEIEGALAALHQYKIARYLADNNPEAAKEARAAYMKAHSETILEELSDMEGSMKKLAVEHDNLDDYYRAVMANLTNISVLREYAEASDAGDVKDKADTLLKILDTFETNISGFIKENIGEVKNISTPAGIKDYIQLTLLEASILTASHDAIDDLQKQYDELRNNLLDEDIMTTIKSKTKDAIDWDGIVDLEGVEQNKLKIIAGITGISAIADEADDYEKAVIDLGKKLDAKKNITKRIEKSKLKAELRDTLQTLEKTYDPSKPVEFNEFLVSVSELRDTKGLFEFEDKEKINQLVRNYIATMIGALFTEGADIAVIESIEDDFSSLQSELGTGGLWLLGSKEGNSLENVLNRIAAERAEFEVLDSMEELSFDVFKTLYPDAHRSLVEFIEENQKEGEEEFNIVDNGKIMYGTSNIKYGEIWDAIDFAFGTLSADISENLRRRVEGEIKGTLKSKVAGGISNIVDWIKN